jgi:multidrug efflux pump subunit AcrA (membrane-fusion protein)
MNQAKSRKGKWIIAGLVILVILAVVFFLFQKKNQMPDRSELQTAQATVMTIEKSITSDGEIVSSLEEDAAPHTSYYLEEICVEEGQALSEGDTILTYTNGDAMEAPYNCVVESWNLPDAEEQLTDDHYVKIAGTDVMQMEIEVSEEDVSQIGLGDEAVITVDAVNKTYTGTVDYISEVGSYSGGSSTFLVKVSFDSDKKIKLGMSGSVSIVLDRAENVVAVPAGAVTAGREGSMVMVVDGEEQNPVSVETGISNDSFIEIKSGIEEGTTVAVLTSDDDSDSFGGFGGFSGGPGGMPGGGGGSSDGSNRPSAPPDGMPSGGSGGPGNMPGGMPGGGSGND